MAGEYSLLNAILFRHPPGAITNQRLWASGRTAKQGLRSTKMSVFFREGT
jgi:hypothetical protein